MVFSSEIFLFVFLPALLIVYYLPIFKKLNGNLNSNVRTKADAILDTYSNAASDRNANSCFNNNLSSNLYGNSISRKTRKYRNFILLAGSLFFYWWGEPVFFLIMCFSIIVNWILGLCIDKHRAKKKLWVILLCLYNIGILFIFKYLTFVTENIAFLSGNDSMIIRIALPIGISFFTFQMMSYVFDVANEKAGCQKNILNVALYITMFPQLIAGPIVRYETVADEINNRQENWTDFSEGICRFIKGLSKKVILANQIGILADMIFDNVTDETSAAVLWLGAIAYTLQIFYDFSGYSDMAIGLGRMFGFHFLENFNFPYISKSITEFWRRWHISMGTWFRDYLYIPLGGSRVNSKRRLLFNLFVVWLCTGIWHGANWTFIVWGLMYFVLLSFEKLTEIHKLNANKNAEKSKFLSAVGGGVLAHLYTMFFVVIGWVIFRSESIHAAGGYIRRMFCLAGNPLFSSDVCKLGASFIVFLILAIIFCFPIEKIIETKIDKAVLPLRVLYIIIMLLLLAVSVVFVIKGGYNPFIYFNF